MFYLDYLTLQGKTLAASHGHYLVTAASSMVTRCRFPMTRLWALAPDGAKAGWELKYFCVYVVSQRLRPGLLPAIALHRLQEGPQLEMDPRAQRLQSQLLCRELSVPLECQQPL